MATNQNDSIVLMDVMKALECPVCMNCFDDKIFLCEAGHSLCEQCTQMLENNLCPECRGPMSESRNFCLEDVASKVFTKKRDNNNEISRGPAQHEEKLLKLKDFYENSLKRLIMENNQLKSNEEIHNVEMQSLKDFYEKALRETKMENDSLLSNIGQSEKDLEDQKEVIAGLVESLENLGKNPCNNSKDHIKKQNKNANQKNDVKVAFNGVVHQLRQKHYDQMNAASSNNWAPGFERDPESDFERAPIRTPYSQASAPPLSYEPIGWRSDTSAGLSTPKQPPTNLYNYGNEELFQNSASNQVYDDSDEWEDYTSLHDY